MPRAQSIRCSKCGASIEARAALVAPCRSCGHEEPVPPEVVAEVRRYESEYAASLHEANASREQAASAENMAGQIPSSGATLKLFGMMLAFAMLVGGVMQFLLMSPSCRNVDAGPAIMLLPICLLGFWLGVPLFLSYRRSRHKAERIAAGSIPVACPSCGGDNVLSAGDAGEVCRYCSARLVPTKTLARQVLDAGAIEKRRSALRALRAQRRVTLRYRQATVSPGKVIIGSFGALIVLSALGGLSDVVARDSPMALPAIGGVAMMLIVLSAPFIAYRVWRNGQRDAWVVPLRDLAHQFDGMLSHDLSRQVEWLDGLWPESYSEYWIAATGHRFALLTAGVEGYSVLLDVHPEKPYGNGRHAEPYQPRLNILVAAHIPLAKHSLARLHPDAVQHRAVLNKMGFTITLSTSGILAQATSAQIAHFLRTPADLHSLAQALQAAARLAKYLGPPATPLD